MKHSGSENFQKDGGSENDIPYACVQKVNLVSLGSRALCTSVVFLLP